MRVNSTSFHHSPMGKAVLTVIIGAVLLVQTRVASASKEENSEARTCSSDEESCLGAAPPFERKSMCDVQVDLCHKNSSKLSLYRHGGSAQAYKPLAPKKSTVCDITTFHSDDKKQPPNSLVSKWPFSRGRRRGSAPTLHIRGRIWSCSESSSSENRCCCDEINVGDNKPQPVVEVWQARPDGTYSSISPNSGEDGDCRATVPSVDSLFEFGTLLPGSTGILGGLGPFKFDFFPYGPPVLHVLISAPQHEPLLTNVPMMTDRSLESSLFWGPDLRGPNLVSQKRSDSEEAYKVTSWTVQSKSNQIHLEIDFYLTRTEDTDNDSATLHQALCPSSVYGFPTSFFNEPIAICAPSMLDFFAF